MIWWLFNNFNLNFEIQSVLVMCNKDDIFYLINNNNNNNNNDLLEKDGVTKNCIYKD